ncbi:MAG TPA: hypothetical protein VGH52_05965 [Gaiellaceae bacterium]
MAGAILGAARASQAAAPVNGPAAIKSLRSTADYYRSLTWTYQAAAKHPRTRSSLSYRRSRDGAYLRWTVAVWQGNAARARRTALAVLHKRLGITLPADPGRHASLASRIAYDQRVTTKLQGLARAAKRTDRSLASASVRVNEYELRQWQTRVAHSLLDVSRHVTRMSLAGPVWLTGAFLCIHHFEGAWNDDTGNGYYGGLQMSRTFMERYGADFLRRYGTADRWPPWAQVQASVRAYQSGRGFWPWPRTAADCGLL